jgi:uncharacterized repeat protein (TIGR03987 family)
MHPTLMIAVTAITMALAFYTVGVWAERRAGLLKKWHVVIFWAGLLCDTAGTTAMTQIARQGAGNPLHAVTGAAAIMLMICHAVWATAALCSHNQNRLATFHRFSLLVWLIWLIPFFSGMFIGMG